jgi:tetratricopeptide (TPR) repeat protein
LVRNLIEDGLVRVTGGRVTLGTLDESRVPSTLEGVVVSRFDRLPVDEQDCLKAAAVVGRVVDPRTVSASLGENQERQLERLVLSGMLRRHGPDLEFSHVISRDVVYAMMAGAQRVELHRAVAAHLQLDGHNNPREVGHHWLNAGETDRAITFLTSAADAALHTGSFVDARALYDQVDGLRGTSDDPTLGAMIRIRAATASFYLGDMPRAVTDLEAAVSVLDRPAPTGGRRSARRRSRSTLPASSLTTDDQRALLDAYQRLSQLNYLRGAPALEIHHTATRAQELAEQLGDTNAEAWACAQLSAVSGMLGRTKQLDQYSRRAISLVEDGQADQVASDVWRTIGVACSGLGQWDAALAALDNAAAHAQAGRQAGIWQTRAAIYLCAGDYRNAETEWRRAAEAGEAIGNRVQVYWSRLDEIQTLIGQNRIDDATRALATLEGEFGAPTDPLGRIEYHYTAALVHGARGDHATAVQFAAVVMQMVESGPPSGFHWVEFCSGVVEVHLAAVMAARAAGSPPDRELLARTEHAVGVLKQLSELFLHVAPRVDLSLGLLAANQGQTARARRSLARAAADARRARLDFDEARATLLFESLSEHPDGAELDRVAAVFERLGAARWLARVDLVRRGVRLAAPGG